MHRQEKNIDDLLLERVSVVVSKENKLFLAEEMYFLIIKLNMLGVKSYFFEVTQYQGIELFLNWLQLVGSWCNNAELKLTYEETLYCEKFLKTTAKYDSISLVIIEEAPKEETFLDKVYFIDRKLNLNVDQELQEESDVLKNRSQKHNLFHYQRCVVDCLGFLRRFEGDQLHFGKISKMSFAHIKRKVESSIFQLYWNVTKEQIKDCCECRFRYKCADSRIPKLFNEKWKYETECQIM